MTDSLYQSFGGTDLPAELASDATTLVSLDPARAKLAGLFEAAINAELGAAWTQIVATLGTTHPLYGTSPVQDVLELEPSPQVMKERKPVWPLLCVHRTGEARFEHLAINGQVERLIQPWDVHYILGPLDVGGLRKLSDVCSAVAKIVSLCVRKRGHPEYENGALQFYPPNLSGTIGVIGSAAVTGYSGPGQATFSGSADAPVYYAITIHLETSEHTRDNPDADIAFEAADIIVAGGSGEGIMPDLVMAQTDAEYPYQQG